ncbi:unnamed protein product [Lactuca virosa]|uniref:Auxin response factor n=1 Tax=Lactuca virosa TaxID=75947 RepID=A0AAU9MUX6_9ASTR|nr:unnamed protein product [Lactuca virosa]
MRSQPEWQWLKVSWTCSSERDNDTCQGNDQVDLHTQLWHECAGLTVKVPRVGDKVFYFPQGHLQQVEVYMKQEGMSDIPSYGLPSKILCKVVCVQLKAEVDTDEVFAQITLIPDFEEPKGSTFRSVPQKIPATSFRKKLTPSDVIKQGGCNLHKKHVDQTFPPLDMSQDAPSQELFAKDLHGKIWNFHHICRGVPKRHILTTGWGKFVSAKRLVVGDTCIFLRGQNRLYVGVQRAVRLNKLSTDLSCVNMQHGILLTALEAINTRTEFTVYYHPRISPSGFIVAYNDFMESLKVNFSPETRVEMVLDEGGEEPEFNLKKFSGIIIGKEDVDPSRWPESEWHCLKVCWHGTASGDVPPKRVSPWSIQSVVSVPQPQKRSMIGYNNNNNNNNELGMQGEGIRMKEVSIPKVNNIPREDDERSKKCRVFGVDIGGHRISNTHPPDSSNAGNQQSSYIKVLKHGSFVGRCVEVSRFSGYGGLMWELDRMFGFQGGLVSGTSGWIVTYNNNNAAAADGDGDANKKLLGDVSWSEFRGVVRKMCICPKEKEEAATWNKISG